MCLIIDVNVAHKILLANDDPDFKDVHECLFTGKMPHARMAYGGKLAREYLNNHKIRRVLVELDRAGRAWKVDDSLIEREIEWVVTSGLCQSDDEHIIGLARVSGVRLLCSHDQSLHIDFTNKALLDKPRGKVYQTKKHKKLLTEFCS